MINILVDELPTRVNIGGTEYEINSNYSVSLLFEILIQDKNLEKAEILNKALSLYYYPQTIPKKHMNEAVDKMLWFYRCGRDIKQSKGKGKSQKKQIYSFEDDAEYIFAAFLDQYGINLNRLEYLHWWEFRALFKALKEDNEIVKIIGYRAKDLSKIKNKDEKAYYRQMQELYKIEEALTDEEKEDIEKWKELLK